MNRPHWLIWAAVHFFGAALVVGGLGGLAALAVMAVRSCK